MSAITRRSAGVLAPAVATVLAVATALALTACTSSAKRAGPATVSSQLPSSAIVSSPAPASSSAPAPAVLPADCPHLLPLGAVEQAVGKPLYGQVTYLRAAPVPKSGRTGRVTCGYGTASKPDAAAATDTASPTTSPTSATTAAVKPLIEASYITYVDAATAKDRVALTVQHDGATSTVSKVDVHGIQASVLIGPQWHELLMSDGTRTIVVVMAPSLMQAVKAPAALVAMATIMLKFGVPAASAVGSPAAAAS